jgi:hypothetical protein
MCPKQVDFWGKSDPFIIISYADDEDSDDEDDAVNHASKSSTLNYLERKVPHIQMDTKSHNFLNPNPGIPNLKSHAPGRKSPQPSACAQLCAKREAPDRPRNPKLYAKDAQLPTPKPYTRWPSSKSHRTPNSSRCIAARSKRGS